MPRRSQNAGAALWDIPTSKASTFDYGLNVLTSLFLGRSLGQFS